VTALGCAVGHPSGETTDKQNKRAEGAGFQETSKSRCETLHGFSAATWDGFRASMEAIPKKCLRMVRAKNVEKPVFFNLKGNLDSRGAGLWTIRSGGLEVVANQAGGSNSGQPEVIQKTGK
jgi:hypothetical protein